MRIRIPLFVCALTAVAGLASAQSIALNGVSAPTAVSVVAGQSVAVTVAGGPGSTTDMVALAPTGASNGTMLDYRFLNNTVDPPSTGLTGGTLTFTAPATPGEYEYRFWGSNGTVRLATSGPLTVMASPAVVTVNGATAPTATSVTAGQPLLVTVANGPGNFADMITLALAGSSDTAMVDYRFLNNTVDPPSTALTGGRIDFYAPAAAGDYEVRFFANGKVRLTTSGVVTVAASPAVVTVNGATAPSATSVVIGQLVVVTVTNGPGNTSDLVALAPAGSPAGTMFDYRYLNNTTVEPSTALTAGTMTFMAPAPPGDYEVRLFAANGKVWLATSGALTVGASPAGLQVNGVLPPTPVPVAPGTYVSVDVTDGPGNAGDWVGLYAASAPDASPLVLRYLNGSTTAPVSGVTEATLSFAAPTTAGSYEFRFFSNYNHTLRLATSTSLVVSSPTAHLSVNGVAAPTSATALPGTMAVVSVAGGPGNLADYVGLYLVGASDGDLLDWRYLNDTGVAPTSPLTAATLHFAVPTTPGTYEFRLFMDDTLARLATSGPMVVPQTPAQIAVNGTAPPTSVTVAPGSTITVTIAGAPGNPTDWVGLAVQGSANNEYLDWQYLNGSTVPPSSGLTTATLSFTLPAGTATYELRLFAMDLELLIVASAPVVASTGPPVATVTLTSPFPGTTFNAPASLLVTAQATISSSTIQRVEFYDGAVLIGSASSAPYAVTWTAPTAGVHSLKAVAVDQTDSTTASAAVPVFIAAAGSTVGTLASPTITPASGPFSTSLAVTIAAAPGTAIHYTLDGSTPTASSPVYSGPLTMSASVVVQAIAVQSGWTDSDVAAASYVFSLGTLTTPTATPAAGTYATPQVIILSADSGATIRFTVDGSEPTEASSPYTTPLGLGLTTTLRARAFRTDYTPSSILTAQYLIDTSSGIPTGDTPPPDPATVAPPLSQVELTPFHDQVSFLYSGTTPIQQALVPGTLQDFRVAVLRGKVLTRDGQPLPGARIRIAGQSTYGYTISRADGMFDLVVNGGGPMTIEYTRNGFLPVQRSMDPRWNDYAWAPDVRMVQLDTNVTTADFSVTAPAQVVRGSVQTDASGTRQATLIIPEGGVMAAMTLPNGTVMPNLATLALRATEYTVGPGGLQAMPASLPPASAYTYAVELSADEALATNATKLTFTPPLPFYVENFLGFPVGIPVPVGTYDRALAAWLPEDNGRVVRVLAADGQGRAELDLDGTGVPADASALAALGVTDGERQRLASLYTAGQSLWRAPIAHFSPFDLNQSERVRQYLQGEVIPLYPPPLDLETDRQEDRACNTRGSVIECQNQTLGEDLPVAGTPFSLVYRSNRVSGRVASRTVELAVTGDAPATSLLGAVVTVNVGGRTFAQNYGSAANQRVAFTWNGLDAYGRRPVGMVPLTVRVAYDYEAEYVTNMVDRAFSIPGGALATSVVSRLPQQLSTTAATELRGLTPMGVGANGWSLDVHHQYDVAGEMLRLGTGELRQASAVVPVVETAVTGDSAVVLADGSAPFLGSEGYNRRRPDGFDEIVSTTPPLGVAYHQVAAGPDGALYYVSAHNIGELTFDRIYVGRYSATGEHTALADIPLGGSGECPIVVSSHYTHIAVAPDRTVYVSLGPCLYRVLPDGQRYRMREAASGAYSGLAVGTDGTLYVSDVTVTGSQILKLVPTGDWEIVAGSGLIGPSADGVPATSVPIDSRGIAIDRSGILYFQDQSIDANTGAPSFRIRKVGPGGILSPVGGGANLPIRDGWPAAGTDVRSTYIAVGPDDDLYLVGRRIRGVGPRRTAGPAAYQFPSDTGAQIYDFNEVGTHLRTRDALTGVTLFSFIYTDGHLTRIRDREGLETVIERTVGVPTAIVSPFGVRTTLSVDANRDLRVIGAPEAQTHEFDYVDGLMTRMEDPTNAAYGFSYDDDGRLETDSDSEGGVQTLSRVATVDGWAVTRTQSDVGGFTYVTERPRTGGFRSVTIGPDGTTTTSRTTLDGRTVTSGPDGTVATMTVAPDSRFGLVVPVVESARVRTPAGLEQLTAQTREVYLADQDDLASVQYAVDTTTINGRTYTSTYDANAGTILSTSPEGRQTLTTLDALGRPSSVQIGDLAPMEFHYDAAGRLVERVQGARTTTLSYDSRGYLDSVTDPLARTVSFTNDGLGRAHTQTFPDNRVATFRYDGNSNLQALTPPGRPQHEFDYTGVNLLETYTPPTASGAGPTGYSYDTARRPQVVTRADGQTLTFGYETGTGRLESLATSSGTTTYGYEGGSGRLATVTAPGATLAYGYDGTLLRSETWSGGATGAVAWTYDNDFRVSAESVRDAFNVSFGYDSDGILMSAGDTTYTRFPATGLLETSTVGGVATTFGYNEFGELTSHTTSVGAAPVYSAIIGRDAAGRIQQQTETLASVTTADVYGYDAAGRLHTVTRNGTPVVTYGYDTNGNRNAVTTSGGIVSATFDAQDRILTFGTRTYTHTPHGDVAGWTDSATSTTTTLTYDVQGNLRQVTMPGMTVTYTVDGRNRRIGKSVNGVQVQGLLWQGQLRPVAELDGSGNVVSRFVYGTRINVPEYMERGGTTYRLVTDHLGSVRLVIDTATNTVAQALTFDPWGVVVQDTNPGFQPFGYAGGLYEYRTGLVRFGARDYDAAIGRWLAKDPSGFSGGDTNLYTYVFSRPLDAIDLTGNKIEVIGDVKPFWVAVSYLERDPGMARILQKLIDSDEVFTVIVADTGPNQYDFDTRTVYWRAYCANLTSTGGTQSPALALGHELAHAAGPRGLQGILRRLQFGPYDDAEEERVIKGPEANAAKTLGEHRRYDHRGTLYWVGTPISR